MKLVLSVEFVNQVRRRSKADTQALRKHVEALMSDPYKHDGVVLYPWDGAFEKRIGAQRIVYCVPKECRKKGVAEEHGDCKDYDDDTVVLRLIYTML